jgi:hypothetical protein
VKVTYRNEPESVLAIKHCLGSPDEPTAEPGNLCLYRGAGTPKEPTHKNAKFVHFVSPFGEEFNSGTTLT